MSVLTWHRPVQSSLLMNGYVCSFIHQSCCTVCFCFSCRLAGGRDQRLQRRLLPLGPLPHPVRSVCRACRPPHSEETSSGGRRSSGHQAGGLGGRKGQVRLFHLNDFKVLERLSLSCWADPSGFKRGLHTNQSINYFGAY